MKLYMMILAVVLQSCASGDNDASRADNRSVLIGKGELYGNGAENIPRQNIVLYNQSDWNNLIQKMNTVNPVSREFSETNIDFNNFQVIAVFDEIKRSGGHSIDITEITENEDTIVVRVQNLNTGGGISVMTQPYHIVKIPKSKKAVVFR